MPPESRLDRGDGVDLAYHLTAGRAPTVVFLPGFMSDMTGDKALALECFCSARGRAFLRLDYSGHGASGGRFEDGTIGRWLVDVLAVVDRVTDGPMIVVGSSMGGWIALLTALARPDRVSALVGIAAAPDFTERLIWAAIAPPERVTLLRDGRLALPSRYGGEQVITRALIEDGGRHLLLDRPIPIACPVRLLHGQADTDVPWETALVLARQLDSADVRAILIKDGEHRLSRPQDIRLLCDTVGEFLVENGA